MAGGLDRLGHEPRVVAALHRRSELADPDSGGAERAGVLDVERQNPVAPGAEM